MSDVTAETADLAVRFARCPAILLECAAVVFLLTCEGFAADDAHPLETLDTSSPRATLSGFLQAWDEAGEFWKDTYRSEPSRHNHRLLVERSDKLVRALDTSDLPPALRREAALASAAYLYEVLCKIELPPEEVTQIRSICW